MDFELSDEQTMLRDTVRDVLGKLYDIERFRAVTDTERGWDEQVWSSLAEIGILGLVIPEAYGGVGAGAVELSAVMTELGAGLSPEPLLDSVVVPAVLLRAAGDTYAELLEGLASGKSLAAFAHHESGDRWPHAAVQTTATDGDEPRITGNKSLVPHGDCADHLVVSARSGDDIGLYLVAADADGVHRTPYRTHDRRRGAQIVFDGAPAQRIGAGDASQIITDAEVWEQTALCAEAVGAMDRVLSLTVEYLKTRKQFGVTLSTFQALTHRAADMYVQLELARSMSMYATVALAEGQVDPVIASRAKLQICRSARLIGQEGIQMHGGIGMTAEYPVGHYVSRLTAISHTLGGVDAHLERLAAGVADYEMITVG